MSAPPPARRLFAGELGRVNHEPANRTLQIIAPLLHWAMRLWTRATWRGAENLPLSGPAIIVANHISSLDPPLVAEFVVYNGRWPSFLARANLFEIPVVGRLLHEAGQIPVHRASRQAADALVSAEAKLQAGKVVVIYPEGTITLDPDEWPMAGYTGAARLAFSTGAPVIPIGQWGANYALPSRKIRPFRLRRTPITIVCGPPVDLSDLPADPEQRTATRQATVRIMDAITGLAEQARGAQAPAGRWSSRVKRRVPRSEAVM